MKTTINVKGFRFTVQKNRFYILMKRNSNGIDEAVGRSLMGDEIHTLPTSEEGLDSSFYLKRVKCIDGTHTPATAENVKKLQKSAQNDTSQMRVAYERVRQEPKGSQKGN